MGQQSLDCLESATLSLEEETWALAQLARYGYFRLPAITSPGVINRMYLSVESLRSARWPAVFSFVYDEFWAILRTPSVVRLLSRQLGAGYLQTALSLAVEFIHEGERPSNSELPVFDTNLPDLASRLRVIGCAILAYEKFEPGDAEISRSCNQTHEVGQLRTGGRGTMWERYERGEPPASFAVEPIACPNRSGLVILSTTGSTRSTLTYEIGSKI